MIQINLLPDVKLEYIKAQRDRRLITTVSIIVSGISLGILVILFIFDLGQKIYIHDLNDQVKQDSSQLQGEKNLDSILTTQSQTANLTSLLDDDPAAGRLLDTYLNELTPNSVSISNISVTFTGATTTSTNKDSMQITGNSDNLADINQYVDTFKNTTYSIKGSNVTTNAFSAVVLDSFGINPNPSNPSIAASYTINLTFDPTIFDVTKDVTLNIPPIVIRSGVSSPNALFVKPPSSKNNTSNGGQ